MRDYNTISMSKVTSIKLLLTKATKALAARPEVIFAYAFGSAISGPVAPHDLDLAVYVNERDLSKSLFEYELELGSALEQTLGYDLPLDLVMVNKAPAALRHAIFSKGQFLFARDENLLTDLIEATGQAAFERYPAPLALAELMS